MHARIALRSVRLGLGVLLTFAAAGVPARAAPSTVAQTPLPHTLSVALSSERPSAHPVAVSVQLGYEMQCGYPGPGPVVLTFPAAEHVPARISATSVLVDGKAAPSVAVAGTSVTVGLAPPPQIMCDVIGPGRLTIRLTRSAGLGNPARSGSYLLRATRGATSFSTRFTISGA